MSLSNLAPRYVVLDLGLLCWWKNLSLNKQNIMNKKGVGQTTVALLHNGFDIYISFFLILLVIMLELGFEM